MNNESRDSRCGCGCGGQHGQQACPPLEPIVMPCKVCNIVKCHPIEQPLVQFNDLFEFFCVKN